MPQVTTLSIREDGQGLVEKITPEIHLEIMEPGNEKDNYHRYAGYHQ
jgi:hypothetical protein